jgi:hypothetical protein
MWAIRRAACSVYPDSVPVPAGDVPPGAEPAPGLEPAAGLEPVPMLGQSLLDRDDDEPLALLEGVELVDPEEFEPEEFEVAPVPDTGLVPLVPLLLVAVEPVLDVLVAALATSAPPVTSPAVRAPTATARRR